MKLAIWIAKSLWKLGVKFYHLCKGIAKLAKNFGTEWVKAVLEDGGAELVWECTKKAGRAMLQRRIAAA